MDIREVVVALGGWRGGKRRGGCSWDTHLHTPNTYKHSLLVCVVHGSNNQDAHDILWWRNQVEGWAHTAASQMSTFRGKRILSRKEQTTLDVNATLI